MSEFTSEPQPAFAMAAATPGEFRAGGTDVSERRRSGRSAGPIVDLTGLPGLTEITPKPAGGVRIGALVTVEQVAREMTKYPALAATSAALATPEIRAVATMGGNLLQRTRCAYYRNPAFTCFKSGGTSCPARRGHALHSVVDDRGPCIAPHPSSVGMALLTYDATVEVADGPARTVTDLFGDGSDGSRDHQLGDQEILTAVVLPAPTAGERGAYERATSRRFAEWPLVEAVARIGVTDGQITTAAVGAGAVAPVPMRLPAVESILLGRRPDPDVLAAAAEAATDGFRPLEQTAYKLPLLRVTVLDVLQRASSPGR
jgi:xanthine dehydrogenase YagS FAD-binding subunit